MTRPVAEDLDRIKPLFSGGGSPTLQAVADALNLSSRANALKMMRRFAAAGFVRRIEAPGLHPRYELVREADRLAAFSDAALLAEVRRRGLA